LLDYNELREKIMAALIEEVSGAVRTSGPRERGDRVNYQANVLRLPSLFGAMTWANYSPLVLFSSL
jgi:hypothetical protein